MGEKDFTLDNDFQKHLKDDWKTVHGIWEGAKPYIDSKVVSENWINVSTFYNSWVNRTGEGYAPARYFKDRLGIVHIEGYIKDGTAGETGTVFILPTGYRPSYHLRFATIRVGNDHPASIRVLSTGEVQVIFAGGCEWVSLDGITFRVA